MARTLIICPTHDHGDTLFTSVASLQAQTDPDWRLVVICDGAPQRSLDILSAISASDSRVECVSHPKGARFGEDYRDPVVRGASEELVLHLGDDDVWARDHLAHMRGLLDQADWAYSGELAQQTDGSFGWRFAHHGAPLARAQAAHGSFIDGGLNNVAFRRDAYMRLERGWQAAPSNIGSDAHMWRVFMADPTVRIACTARPSFIKLAGRAARRGMPSLKRLAEAAPVLARVNAPGFIDASRRAAALSLPVLKMLNFNRAEAVGRFEDAMARCGLRLAPQDGAFSTAMDGGTMSVPLSDAQRDQILFSWHLLRATRGDLGELTVLHGFLPRFRPLLSSYLSAQARSDSELFRPLLGLVEDVLGLSGVALHARARNAIARGALAEAETTLRDAERQQPDGKWINAMRAELAELQAHEHDS